MHTRIASLFAAGLALALTAPVHAQGPDELWEVRSTMTMEGMRIPTPPVKVCSRGTQPDRMTPMDKNCKLSDVKTSGNRTTYRITCSGKDAMTGSGEITRGNGTYQGILKLTHGGGGQTTTMVTEYAGKLIGKCTAK